MTDSNRQTGRTRRLLQQAVEAAALGQRVTFVTHSPQFITYAMRMTLDLVAKDGRYKAQRETAYTFRLWALDFELGSIYFHGLHNIELYMAGQDREKNTLIFDHTAVDHFPRWSEPFADFLKRWGCGDLLDPMPQKEKLGRIIAGLYNNAKPLGLGKLHYTPEKMTGQIMSMWADACVQDGSVYFDYLMGRVIKCTVQVQEPHVPRMDLYDRDNGEGACEKAILDGLTDPYYDGIEW